MFTIFINNNPVYLTDDLKHTSKINFFYFDEVDIYILIEKIENNELKEAYLYNSDIKLLFKKFKSNFKIIEAAGGLVINSKKEILFIYRNDKWDLPKGKIEKGEKIVEAALREVEEETGVQHLNIIKSIENTYHIYTHNNKKIFKVTYWFIMETDFTGVLLPQLEEGITKVVWLNKKQIKKAMENTYANIELSLNQNGFIYR